MTDLHADTTTAQTDLIRSALRFAYLAAGEGISIDGLEPGDFMMEYSVATGDEDLESIPDRLCRATVAQDAEAHADRLADALHHMVNAALHPDQMADEALTAYNAWRAKR